MKTKKLLVVAALVAASLFPAQKAAEAHNLAPGTYWPEWTWYNNCGSNCGIDYFWQGSCIGYVYSGRHPNIFGYQTGNAEVVFTNGAGCDDVTVVVCIRYQNYSKERCRTSSTGPVRVNYPAPNNPQNHQHFAPTNNACDAGGVGFWNGVACGNRPALDYVSTFPDGGVINDVRVWAYVDPSSSHQAKLFYWETYPNWI